MSKQLDSWRRNRGLIVTGSQTTSIALTDNWTVDRERRGHIVRESELHSGLASVHMPLASGLSRWNKEDFLLSEERWRFMNIACHSALVYRIRGLCTSDDCMFLCNEELWNGCERLSNMEGVIWDWIGAPNTWDRLGSTGVKKLSTWRSSQTRRPVQWGDHTIWESHITTTQQKRESDLWTLLAIVHLTWHSWLSHGGQRQYVLIRETGGFELDDLQCLFLHRLTHELPTYYSTFFNLKFGTSNNLQTTLVYVNCHPVPSRLEFPWRSPANFQRKCCCQDYWWLSLRYPEGVL